MRPSQLLRCALHPLAGFRERAAEAPGLGASFGWMLLLRGSAGILSSLLLLNQFYREYLPFRDIHSSFWKDLLPLLPAGIGADDIRAYLAGLPALPPIATVRPWMLLMGPIGIASAWLHNAVWDHACLWLLRGVARTGSWRTTFLAEAEAMQVGVLGAVFGLLGFLPAVGPLFAPFTALLGVYFWVMRGFSLAAFHGAPAWKGALATVLHVLLASFCLCGMLAATWILVMRAVAE